MTTPDVTVVVIAYNDAARLPRAIRSIQRQTLRNLEIVVVDDASTDDTEAVVSRLAAADPRIRYERLADNSGGCSAPRNRGMAVATAPWVMFCDSDDEYERHACKNLLLAAERLDADIVCGTAERVDVATGVARRWRPDLHDAERVADGLADFPELLYDTISVNKIYRRSLLEENAIAFPEGLLYEDQLFTLEAFAAARRVAAIPETVYRWYVVRLSEEPSITQRRDEARNVESRVEINRRIDAFLRDRGLADIQRLKDVKFLRHDLYLYLSSMVEIDDDLALVLIDRLQPYVSQIALDGAWELRPGLRIALFHLLLGDLDGIRSAMRLVRWASVVDVPIVQRDGVDLWGCEHAADPIAVVSGFPVAAWLDVSTLGLLRVPFTQRRYCHVLESLDVRDGVVTVTGSTTDYDGSVSARLGIEVVVLVNGSQVLASLPAAWTGAEGHRRTWRASGQLDVAPRIALREKDRGTLAIALTDGDLVNVTGVRAAEATVPRRVIRYRGRTSGTGPDAIVTGSYENGGVGWRTTTVGGWHRARAHLRRAWLAIPGAGRLSIVGSLIRRDWIPAVVQEAGAVRSRRNVVLVETNEGRTVSGNARAIGDELHRRHPNVQQVWVFRTDPTRVPSYATGVERLSLRHLRVAARARLWLDDGTASLTLRKANTTTSVYVGHGIPVHRVGLDDPSTITVARAVKDIRQRSGRWDLALAGSRFDNDIIRRAWAFDDSIVISGLPRADVAVSVAQARDDVRRARRAQLAAALDLPTDRRIVMYAPTARVGGDRSPREPLVDLDDWMSAVGDRVYLVLRPPLAERFAVPTRTRSAVRDIADVDAVADYLAVADLFVSDYSSLLVDAAASDKPLVLFQPDHDVYVNRTHGLYMDPSVLGPSTATTPELIVQVRRWLDSPDEFAEQYAVARSAFVAQYCATNDGYSASRAVDAIMRRPS